MNFRLLVIDTNFYSALARGNERVRQLIRSAEEIALPQIVIGELLGGFHYGTRFNKNYSDLREVMSKPSCRVLIPSMETASLYGKLYSDLKKKGTMIPTNDIWIAALTIEYEGVLATFDTDFDSISNLETIR